MDISIGKQNDVDQLWQKKITRLITFYVECDCVLFTRSNLVVPIARPAYHLIGKNLIK